jgi:hypothetical protein
MRISDSARTVPWFNSSLSHYTTMSYTVNTVAISRGVVVAGEDHLSQLFTIVIWMLTQRFQLPGWSRGGSGAQPQGSQAGTSWTVSLGEM